MSDLSHIPGIRSICKSITGDPAYKLICTKRRYENEQVNLALEHLQYGTINFLIRKHCPSTLSITYKILIRNKIKDNIEKMNL
jgi:hypothetical protein